MAENAIVEADNLQLLASLPDAHVQMIYIDPPFNTGKVQRRSSVRVTRVPEDEQTDERTSVGFKGRRYSSTFTSSFSYVDFHDDYMEMLALRLEEARRVLHDTGTIYVHVDYREVHYVKVAMDQIFGRDCFLNELIWAYDYGARAKTRWPAKHDNILVYVKNPKSYYFDSAEVDREPYMAPGLVTPEKAEKGKLPTDVWWHTIVSPTGKEKTGYPTQKPLGILRRMITASTQPGDLVLDFFAGSGSTAMACRELGRRFLMVDNNPEAIRIMEERLGVQSTVPPQAHTSAS